MSRRPNISEQTRVALASFLAQPQEWRYGYDITLETGLKSGTLYPLLMRLHDDGFLEAEWRPSAKAGRPPRHVYRLTRSGTALAREMRPATAVVPRMRLDTAT
jgi:DNA-binding PadR family transcriptional regulator